MLDCKNCITYAMCTGYTEIDSIQEYLNKCSILREYFINRLREIFGKSLEEIVNMYNELDAHDKDEIDIMEMDDKFMDIIDEIEEKLNKEDFAMQFIEQTIDGTYYIPIMKLMNILILHEENK